MWTTFLIASILLFAILYIPGTILLRAFSRSTINSFICAPVISITTLTISGICFSLLNIYSTGFRLLIPLFLISFVFIFVLIYKKNKILKLKQARLFKWKNILRSEWIILATYLLLAGCIVLFYFIQPLDGADSFVQDSDNSWHLSLIQSFATSGDMSILNSTLYHDLYDIDTTLVSSSGSFYPAVWHLLCAIIVSLISCPIPLAANATNFIFLWLVFPSGVYLLLKILFQNNKLILTLGSVICLAFGAFPWGTLIPASGPLYPNFIGLSLFPIAAYAFIRIFNQQRLNGTTIFNIGFCLVAFLAVALCHPNTIFSLAVFLIPFVIYTIYRISKSKTNDEKIIIAACVFTIIFIALIWLACYKMPFLQGVVNFNWESYTSSRQELINLLTLAYRRSTAQLFLALLVIIGIIYCIYNKKYFWIAASYFIACTLCFISATTDGELKSLLTGFWYTDTYRLAANCALFGIPLATLGIYSLIIFIKTIVNLVLKYLGTREVTLLPCIAICFLFLLTNYYPNFYLPGFNNITTTFGDIEYCNSEANKKDRPNLYDQEEQQFVKEVAKIVDKNYLIYNNADDGSAFAYMSDDLNLCYRRSAAELLNNESPQSELLRTSINELTTNAEVRSVIKQANIRYILILDMGGEAVENRCYYGYYTREKWIGINSITDQTSGLKTLLSKGDMRLYEIMDT